MSFLLQIILDNKPSKSADLFILDCCQRRPHTRSNQITFSLFEWIWKQTGTGSARLEHAEGLILDMCSRIGRLPSKKTKPRLETHRSVIGRVPSQLDPDWPMTAKSANTHASPWAEHPSRCAHGPGRGDYATPSRPRRLSACAGGAACVTAVRVSGTDGYQLRQCSAPLTCPVRRGGGACSGLPPRQEPINSWGYFFFVLFWYSHNGSWTLLFTCVCVQTVLGGMRGVCSALKMGLFLHAVGSVPPTESAAERVRLSQKQGCLSRGY